MLTEKLVREVYLWFPTARNVKNYLKWINKSLIILNTINKRFYMIQTRFKFHILYCYSSVAQSYLTLCNPMDYSTPGFPVCHNVPEFAQTHFHWVDDVIQPFHSLSFLHSWPASESLPMSPFFSSSGHSVGPSASKSVLPMNGLVIFRADWFDLYTVQGTLQSLLQNHSLKASILSHSAFLMAQLSYPYMTVTKSKLALLTTQQANESERQGAEARKRL